jgi:uncharacterized protein (TIGR03067 family)
MRFALRGVCLLVSALTLAAEGQELAGFAPLQGEWTVTAAEQGGQPFDAIKGGVLTITADGFALRTAVGNLFEGKLVLDPAARPATIDFQLSDGAVWEGIYTTSGDIFRLNYVERGDAARPTVFATTADTLGTVIVLRRAAAN